MREFFLKCWSRLTNRPMYVQTVLDANETQLPVPQVHKFDPYRYVKRYQLDIPSGDEFMLEGYVQMVNGSKGYRLLHIKTKTQLTVEEKFFHQFFKG